MHCLKTSVKKWIVYFAFKTALEGSVKPWHQLLPGMSLISEVTDATQPTSMVSLKPLPTGPLLRWKACSSSVRSLTADAGIYLASAGLCERTRKDTPSSCHLSAPSASLLKPHPWTHCSSVARHMGPWVAWGFCRKNNAPLGQCFSALQS